MGDKSNNCKLNGNSDFHETKMPFLIGVAGGTASGKVSFSSIVTIYLHMIYNVLYK